MRGQGENVIEGPADDRRTFYVILRAARISRVVLTPEHTEATECPHPSPQFSWAQISFRPAAEPIPVTNACTAAQEGTVGVPSCQHYRCVCAWCVRVKVGGQLSRLSLSHQRLNSGSLSCAASPLPSEPSRGSERGSASHLLGGLCHQHWLRSGDSLGMTKAGISIPLSSQSPTLESS